MCTSKTLNIFTLRPDTLQLTQRRNTRYRLSFLFATHVIDSLSSAVSVLRYTGRRRVAGLAPPRDRPVHRGGRGAAPGVEGDAGGGAGDGAAGGLGLGGRRLRRYRRHAGGGERRGAQALRDGVEGGEAV